MTPIKNVCTTLALIIGLTPAISEAKYYNSSPELQTKKELTPIDPIELASILQDSYVIAFNKIPSDNMLSNAWAQVSTENGQGSRLWNNNFGNIGPKKGEAWYAHSSTESYRSFSSPVEGAIAYWLLIAKRCSSAFRLFRTDNTSEAAIALKACNYYGADVESYSKLMSSLYTHAKRNIIAKMHERKLAKRESEERRLRTQFTPTCGCTQWY